MVSPEAVGLIILGLGAPIAAAIWKIPERKAPEPQNGNTPVTKSICQVIHSGLDQQLKDIRNNVADTKNTMTRIEGMLIDVIKEK